MPKFISEVYPRVSREKLHALMEDQSFKALIELEMLDRKVFHLKHFEFLKGVLTRRLGDLGFSADELQCALEVEAGQLSM